MILLRREPFRLFFALGLGLGLAGVLPWLLFGTGATRTWPGFYHALTMTQGFLVALAVGFLGTMLPRRLNAPPLSVGELALIGLALAGLPLALWAGAGWLRLAEIAYLVVLGTLGGFVLRRLGGSRSTRPPPPSFVLLPIGVVAGVAGAALILASTFSAPPWTLNIGRQLAQQGLLLGLVLALSPLLSPIFATGEPAPDLPPAARRRWMALHGGLGLLLLASFPLEELVSSRLGLGLRGAVCGLEIVGLGRLWAPAPKPGFHRRLFRFALAMVPLGLLAAAVAPGQRVALLHLTFIGGLSLLVFAVSVHVTLLHTGHEPLAERSPWPVVLGGALMVGATLVRVTAERWSEHYFEALALASGLWVAAAILWAAFLLPKWARVVPPPITPGG